MDLGKTYPAFTSSKVLTEGHEEDTAGDAQVWQGRTPRTASWQGGWPWDVQPWAVLHWAAHAHHWDSCIPVGVRDCWGAVRGEPPPPRPKICSVVIPKQMSKTQALPQDVEFSKIRKLRGKKKAQEQQPCLQAGIPCGASLRWDQGTLRQTGPVLTAAKGGTCKRGKSKTYVLVCQKRARRPAPFRDRPAERQSTDVSLSQGCEPAPARWAERDVQAWGPWGRDRVREADGNVQLRQLASPRQIPSWLLLDSWFKAEGGFSVPHGREQSTDKE